MASKECVFGVAWSHWNSVCHRWAAFCGSSSAQWILSLHLGIFPQQESYNLSYSIAPLCLYCLKFPTLQILPLSSPLSQTWAFHWQTQIHVPILGQGWSPGVAPVNMAVIASEGFASLPESSVDAENHVTYKPWDELEPVSSDSGICLMKGHFRPQEGSSLVLECACWSSPSSSGWNSGLILLSLEPIPKDSAVCPAASSPCGAAAPALSSTTPIFGTFSSARTLENDGLYWSTAATGPVHSWLVRPKHCGRAHRGKTPKSTIPASLTSETESHCLRYPQELWQQLGSVLPWKTSLSHIDSNQIRLLGTDRPWPAATVSPDIVTAGPKLPKPCLTQPFRNWKQICFPARTACYFVVLSGLLLPGQF